MSQFCCRLVDSTIYYYWLSLFAFSTFDALGEAGGVPLPGAVTVDNVLVLVFIRGESELVFALVGDAFAFQDDLRVQLGDVGFRVDLWPEGVVPVGSR